MKTSSLFLAGFLLAVFNSGRAAELVYLDPAGVIRWSADRREVALFGANYCLPSSSDYRAAGYVGSDRRKLVEKDMAHFARMGWDAVRICLWGDWENSDVQGNLIVNDHLDVMDYAIAEAKKRGVYILFTPITTYSAWWPDAKASDPYPGFSKHFERSVLGTDLAAIAAQCNYLRQILEHVNPYTGIALKDEPAILFVEMINEPWHHSKDLAGSIAYIDALAGAVRGTGCQKMLFHNLSQDFGIAPAIKASSVPGVTIGWYPTGLNLGRTLGENYLRAVDEFVPMQRADLARLPSIVYEFDSPDMNSGYMYPAMVRAFRGVGAQFAAMFSYDMLDTAPYNLGWQTHFLNLVYSPRKAMSAVIAAEVMRALPRFSHYGDYPDNRNFGPFRVSYEEDSSEMVTAEKYLHANDTATVPPDPAGLRRIAGAGSSPLVDYEGNGAYFLDRLAPGVWRLEVYPDAVLVQDPFAQKQNHQTVSSRLLWQTWPMTIRLPDLGDSFQLAPLNEGNRHAAVARAGRVTVKPGVYLLSRGAPPDRGGLPQRIGQVGLAEFVCPPEPALPAQVVPVPRTAYELESPIVIEADVVANPLPGTVTVRVRAAGETAFRSFPLRRARGYRYAATLAPGTLAGAGFEYSFAVEAADGVTVRSPAGDDAVFTARLVPPTAPLTLFEAAQDAPRLVYTRIGDTVRRGIFKNMPATDTDPAALRLVFPLSLDRQLDDYTASLAVKDRISERRSHLAGARAIRLKVRSSRPGQAIYATLVEADGTAWSRKLALSPGWQDVRLPAADWQIAQRVLLPLGYPGRWNYWGAPAKGRGGPGDRINFARLEHVQISLRPEATPANAGAPGEDAWADIATIALDWE